MRDEELLAFPAYLQTVQFIILPFDMVKSSAEYDICQNYTRSKIRIHLGVILVI